MPCAMPFCNAIDTLVQKGSWKEKKKCSIIIELIDGIL